MDSNNHLQPFASKIKFKVFSFNFHISIIKIKVLLNDVYKNIVGGKYNIKSQVNIYLIFQIMVKILY